MLQTTDVGRIRPRKDQVLIKLEGTWDDYSGPLVLPENIDPEKRQIRFARVVAVGDGDNGEGEVEPRSVKYEKARRSGRHIPVPLEVNQRVIVDEIACHGWWPEVAPGYHIAPWRQLLGIVDE